MTSFMTFLVRELVDLLLPYPTSKVNALLAQSLKEARYHFVAGQKVGTRFDGQQQFPASVEFMSEVFERLAVNDHVFSRRLTVLYCIE